MTSAIRPVRLARALLVAALAGSMLGTFVQPAGAVSTARVLAPAAPSQVKAPVPDVDWKRCRDFRRLRCAAVRVPLDYDRPRGAKIALRLVKRPADRPDRKIGPLFVNPGGPGGSSGDFVLFGADLLGPVARRRFDIIGIDPRGTRGVGFACATRSCGSAVARCTPRPGDPARPAFPPEFPVTRAERQRTLQYDAWFRRICERRGNAIVDHMSTADTARDMDLVRQALGSRQLSYYGISYGSFLGATYAALFPDRVRAMIVDGVLDPVAWTRGRGDSGRRLLVSARLRSGYGAWESLTSAFAECDRVGHRRCAAAGDANVKWRAIMARLGRGPVDLGQFGKITYQDVVGLALFTLYDGRFVPLLMWLIEDLHALIFESRFSRSAGDTARADVAESLDQLRRTIRRNGGPERPSYATLPGFGAVSPSFHGVMCADSVNPRTNAGIRRSDRRARRTPWMGLPWAWASSPCVGWPGSSADAYRGSFRATTANPVLIVGTMHDPATPISGARRLNQLLPGSRMLTLNAWGHGALGVSRCVTERYSSYLSRGALPAPGTVCAADRPLFPQPRR